MTDESTERVTDQPTERRDPVQALAQLRKDPARVERLRTWLAAFGIVTDDPVRQPAAAPQRAGVDDHAKRTGSVPRSSLSDWTQYVRNKNDGR